LRKLRHAAHNGVLRFVIRRLLLTAPVLLGVATLVFSLIHLIPGDPAQAMLGDTASQEEIDKLRVRLGLDRPRSSREGPACAAIATAAHPPGGGSGLCAGT